MHDNYINGYEKKVFEPYNLPRQKLPEVYFQTGDLEIVRRSTLLGGSISGQKVAPLIIERDEMLDIDEPSDLMLAEKKLPVNSTGSSINKISLGTVKLGIPDYGFSSSNEKSKFNALEFLKQSEDLGITRYDTSPRYGQSEKF